MTAQMICSVRLFVAKRFDKYCGRVMESFAVSEKQRSRQKIQSLFSQLRQRGFTDEQLSFIHTPIGLDLGGETPQELAVGILAQLLLVKNGKESRG